MTYEPDVTMDDGLATERTEQDEQRWRSGPSAFTVGLGLVCLVLATAMALLLGSDRDLDWSVALPATGAGLGLTAVAVGAIVALARRD